MADLITFNHWSKVPVMALLAVLTAIAMTYVRYIPGLILPTILLELNRRSLKPFRHDPELNYWVWMTARYAYIVLSCSLAPLFQSEIVLEGKNPIPAWRYLLGF